MSKYSEFFLLGSAEYEPIGERLRLRKFGSWLAEEAWLREEQSKKRAQFTLKAIQIARRIAQEKGMSEEEAFQLLQSDSEDRTELFGEFAEDTSKLMALAPSGKEQFEALVTLFFRNRGEVLDGKKWRPTEDWTVSDTNKLPQAFLRQVEAFMTQEDQAINGEEEVSDEAPK